MREQLMISLIVLTITEGVDCDLIGFDDGRFGDSVKRFKKGERKN